VCPADLVEDFQSGASQTLCARMRFDNLGVGYIMLPVPRTVYYSFVYKHLRQTCFWSAHYGDWALPQFRTRLVGSIKSLEELHAVFGPQFVKPKQQADLGGYNCDLEKGPLCGYLLFLDNNKTFTFSYNHTHQVLKFSFSYLIYCWHEVDGTPGLRLENGNEDEHGACTKRLPVLGLRVRIWWSSLGESHVATVKRWSDRHKSWVLKYDLWRDKVVEDVPVVKWEFIE